MASLSAFLHPLSRRVQIARIIAKTIEFKTHRIAHRNNFAGPKFLTKTNLQLWRRMSGKVLAAVLAAAFVVVVAGRHLQTGRRRSQVATASGPSSSPPLNPYLPTSVSMVLSAPAAVDSGSPTACDIWRFHSSLDSGRRPAGPHVGSDGGGVVIAVPSVVEPVVEPNVEPNEATALGMEMWWCF